MSMELYHSENVKQCSTEPHLCCEIFRVSGIFFFSGLISGGWLEIWQEGGRTAALSALLAWVIVLCLARKQELMNYSSIFPLDLTHSFLPEICRSLLHPAGLLIANNFIYSSFLKLSLFKTLYCVISLFLFLLCLQWAVCYCQALHGEKHRQWVRSQVHQEAPQSGQQARCEQRRDREGSEHPAGASASQHHISARRVREPHRCGADTRAVSRCIIQQYITVFVSFCEQDVVK